MSRSSALRAMIGKEVRTMLRERGQLFGLLIGFAAMIFGFMMPSFQAGKSLDRYFKPLTVEAASDAAPSARPELTREQLAAKAGVTDAQFTAIVRWITLGIVMGLCVFIAIMFGTTMAIAAFVGEREANTVEVLLAAPLTHRRLYALKCLSVVIPATLATAALAALGAAALGWSMWMAMPGWLAREVAVDLLWALPLPLLCVMFTNSLCIAASVRAETVKGASQMVGVVMLMVLLPLVLGPLFLLQWFPSLRAPAAAAGRWWVYSPFIWQYAIMLAAGFALALGLFTVGYLRFNREKMLT